MAGIFLSNTTKQFGFLEEISSIILFDPVEVTSELEKMLKLPKMFTLIYFSNVGRKAHLYMAPCRSHNMNESQ